MDSVRCLADIDLSKASIDFDDGRRADAVEVVSQSVTFELTDAALIVVSAARVDPPGPDRRALDQEWIQLANRGYRAIGMTGWSLRDAGRRNVFLFPHGFMFEKNATVKVRTGIGPNTQKDLFWGLTREVWNNARDTVRLFDAQGEMVTEQQVGN
jgi:hypothetical protein